MGIYQFFAKKVGAKVTALARMVKIIPFGKKKLLILSLIMDILPQKDKEKDQLHT